MNPRLGLLVATVVAFPLLGAGAIACSSTPGTGFDGDDGGGTDGTAPVPDATTQGGDTGVPAKGDSSTPKPDGAVSDGGTTQADAIAPVEGGRCSRVNGPDCDIVLQDCPRTAAGAAQECVALRAPDGGTTTGCIVVAPSKIIPRGQACCIGASGDPCVAGTECVGGDRCADAGPKLGRCSPRCCLADDSPCGADDDGLPGHCNLGIVEEIGGSPLYHVCTYERVCQPFGLRPCGQGRTCLVRDQAGTTSCSDIFDSDGGSGAGEDQPCAAANSCADGLMCIGTADGGFACQYLCVAPGSRPPFDAGTDAAPGYGGCPQGKSCRVTVEGLPAWAAFCD